MKWYCQFEINIAQSLCCGYSGNRKPYDEIKRMEYMCLAVPSKIIEIQGSLARVEVDGVVRETSLLLLDDAKIGDYVIVHAGFAISRLDEDAALQTLADMRQILAADNARRNAPDADV
jgi:hydrogenase expression/formation protein HypC